MGQEQERCKVCDRPMATNADWMGAPEYVPDDYRPELCWTKSQCDAHAVDWRRRALEAEARERWVPVGERLPPEGERVLIAAGGVVVSGALGQFGWWWSADPRKDHNATVTHWRPMPAAPEVP